MGFIVRKFIVILLFINITAHAQNSGSYLIPKRVFVGDHAALVVPLRAASQDMPDIVVTEHSNEVLTSVFPAHEYIDFHKITLQRRTGGTRLMIEFTAFIPGILELPIIEIGGEYFSGLKITVDSVLDKRSAPVLSGPASSLAMPGTALMVYGTMTGITIIILAGIWFAVKGRRFTHKWLENWRRRKQFSLIKKTQKRLCKSVIKGADNRIILNYLSDEFRKFLSFLSGKNCRAMTAREFEKLSFLDSAFLIKFFHNCDNLRFSGASIVSQDALALLADLNDFVTTLENTGEEEAA